MIRWAILICILWVRLVVQWLRRSVFHLGHWWLRRIRRRADFGEDFRLQTDPLKHNLCRIFNATSAAFPEKVDCGDNMFNYMHEDFSKCELQLANIADINYGFRTRGTFPIQLIHFQRNTRWPWNLLIMLPHLMAMKSAHQVRLKLGFQLSICVNSWFLRKTRIWDLSMWRLTSAETHYGDDIPAYECLRTSTSLPVR